MELMNDVLDDQTNQRYKDIAEGKVPQPQHTDILFNTPRRLGILFGVCLVMTFFLNGV